MSTKLTVIVADFTTQLSTPIVVGGTSGTLQSQKDDNGNNIPDGNYYFTLDGSISTKEFIFCTKTGLNLTSIQSVSSQGVFTSGTVQLHRVGGTVTITDFGSLKFLNDLLTGTTPLDSTTPLAYDGVADMTGNDNKLATVAYVKGIAIAGAPDSTTTTKGIGKVSVAPVSPTSPIFVGDNDPRVPTSAQSTALAGNNTSIAVGSGNKYVTQTGLQNRAETSGTSSGGATTSLGTVTITIASPGILTLNNHGLLVGDTVTLATTGALPTGLSTSTTYFVISAGLTTNSFELSATAGGSAINTSGTQSGTHTLTLTTNNYILTLTPQPTAYAAGQEFEIKASFATTGSAQTSVQVGTLPRVFLYKLNGSTILASGDIATGLEFKIKNDGTNFQLTSPVAIPPLIVPPAYKNGTTTHDVSITGTQNIAHGLGIIPKYIRIRAAIPSGGTSLYAISDGTYNGTTSSYIATEGNSPGVDIGSNIIQLSALDATSNKVVSATVTFDATNIILTWTNGNSPTGTASLMWEAFA